MRVGVIAYSFYESDGRVRRYAEALADRGDTVDVIALRDNEAPYHSVIRGVNVYRIQRRNRNEKAKWTYLSKLLLFLLKSGSFITKEHLRNPYELIHVHSVPDFEVFSTFIPKQLGAKIILDIHDIVPEFYASKFNSDRNGFLFKVLCGIERLSTAYSNHVIIANHIWEKVILNRSVKNRGKCSVYLNYPDMTIFHRRPINSKSDKFKMVYPGSLNFHQGLDVAIKALGKIRNELPQAELHIYGEGGYKPALMKLVDALELQDRVHFHNPVPLDKIADKIADADLGIVPKRNDFFGGEAFSTKILEFMSLGIPVIVSRTRIDQFYFTDDVVKFFEPENEDDLAQSILTLEKDKRLRERMIQNASKLIEDYMWDTKKLEYYALVDSLTGREAVPEVPEKVAQKQ
jgi:glycosyltransferase involved in cell wall biosynthesis